MAIDAKLTTEEVIKELAQIAGRPTEDEDEKEKVADEDDGECGTSCLRGNQHIIEPILEYAYKLRVNSERRWLPWALGNPLYVKESPVLQVVMNRRKRINLC